MKPALTRPPAVIIPLITPLAFLCEIMKNEVKEQKQNQWQEYRRKHTQPEKRKLNQNALSFLSKVASIYSIQYAVEGLNNFFILAVMMANEIKKTAL